MEFKITKEQIDNLARTGNADTERYLQCVFPEAFKKELEVARWYKSDTGMLFQFNGKFSRTKDSGSFGFNALGVWRENIGVALDGFTNYSEATKEEVEAVLEKEAIKRYGEDWKNTKIERCLYHGKPGPNSGSLIPLINIGDKQIWNRNACIFHDGIWAEPLKEKTPAPTEKTVITLKKALKILAKKLKVSPENIEIE